MPENLLDLCPKGRKERVKCLAGAVCLLAVVHVTLDLCTVQSPSPAAIGGEISQALEFGFRRLFLAKFAFHHDQEVPCWVVLRIGVASKKPLSSLTDSAIDGDVVVVGNINPHRLDLSIRQFVLSLTEELESAQFVFETTALVAQNPGVVNRQARDCVRDGPGKMCLGTPFRTCNDGRLWWHQDEPGQKWDNHSGVLPLKEARLFDPHERPLTNHLTYLKNMEHLNPQLEQVDSNQK